MLRLTLRTLLAYLDDTLPAGEIKTIGEKVGESEAAQKLVERIKQVTRRRRLTVPPASGPGAFDANDVAEYLDNTLAAEKVGEVEQQCLDSDVHLAEIAACHQILALVLGEQALVPPKAKERMYGLVKGRESIPYRKAAPARKPSEAVGEEDQLPGLSGAWLKFVLPAAALLLLAALGVAVWALSSPPDKPRVPSVAQKDAGKSNDKDKDGPAPKDQEPPKDRDPREDKDKKDTKPTTPDKEKDKKKDVDPVVPEPKDKDKGKQPEGPAKTGRRPPPPPDRVALARAGEPFEKSPGLLLTRREGDSGPDAWAKAPAGTRLFSSDVLMALPGFASVAEADAGARLMLRGTVPHYFQSPGLEAAAVLHASKDVDLDFTLLRGRAFVTNTKEKGPATVRLRFEAGEVWEVTLSEPGGEFGVELWRTYTDRRDRDPLRHVYVPPDEDPIPVLTLVLTRGEATVNVVNSFTQERQAAEAGRPVAFSWDGNGFRGFARLEKMPPAWSKQPGEGLKGQSLDDLRGMTNALKALDSRLRGKDEGTPARAAKDARDKANLAERLVGVYALGALDDVSGVLDALGDTTPLHQIDRLVAADVMRQWAARGAGHNRRLFDRKDKSGLLVTKYNNEVVAEALYGLLFFYTPDKWFQKETFEELALLLKHKNVALAELAYHHLIPLSRGAVPYPPFDAGSGLEQRATFAGVVDAAIEKGQLPPRPQQPQPKDKDKP